MLNVVWGTNIDGKEAFAFVKGFPGLFLLTQRRAIVVGEFEEKKGWFRKKERHRICFEASLDEVKECAMEVNLKKKRHYGYVSFHAHGHLSEKATIQFLKMESKMAKKIKDHLDGLDIRKPLEDSGIILIDKYCPDLEEWLKTRVGDLSE